MELLERETECAILDRLIEGGGLVVFEGPPGAGTSALLRALGARADAAGRLALSARATPPVRDVPFGLARRLLEPYVPRLAMAGWARHARPLFEGDVGAGGMLLEGLVALIDELAAARGLVIVAVDDAHWADEPTLAFLAELVERSPRVPVGVAVSMRTGEAGSALERLRALAGTNLLRPAPLSASAVRDVAGDDALAARVLGASGGNPLLVTELVAAAARSGATELEIPDSLARVMRLRLEGLPAAARALLEALAVLGEGPLRRAAALAELPSGVADTAADALAAREIVERGEPLRFRHPILAEILTAAQPAFELAARHRRAAELVSADGGDDETVAAHLMLSRPAGDPRACRTLRAAAGAALGRGDARAAARMLERALAEPAPEPERGELLVELARAQAAAGLPEAIDRFEQGLRHVRDTDRRAEAWHGLSRLLYARADHAGAAAAAARGLAELPGEHPARERLLADELAGAILVGALSVDAAARTEALVGEPVTEPALLAQLIIHQSWRGIAVGRLPELARAAVAADPLVDPESRGFALAFVAGGLNMVDQPVLAAELLDAGLERAHALGDPLAEVSLRCSRAWARIYAGRLAAAAEDLDAVLELNRLEWSMIDGLCGPPLVALRLEQDDLAGAREALDHARRGSQPGLGYFEGAVALASGDAERALAAFEAAGAQLDGVLGCRNPGVLPWRTGAALAAARLGYVQAARELAWEEVVQARAAGVPRAQGIALRTAGRVAADDVELLEESVAVLERSDARLELARSLIALGTAHRRGRRLKDARAPLGRGLDVARDCDASTLAELAMAELQVAGARPRDRPRRGEAALTASERRVAELAADGRTTRQIAAQLFLSPKTVEGQLTSVYRKLGVSSRTQLAPLLRLT